MRHFTSTGAGASAKIPKGLQPLIDDGMVDVVVRRLKSGKEASVFIVTCGGVLRCAKVYKEAEHRGFHKLAQYQEGRKTVGARAELIEFKRRCALGGDQALR